MTHTWRRRMTSRLAVGLCAASVVVALTPLAFIRSFVVTRGLQAINWDFFTKMPHPVGEAGGGMANASPEPSCCQGWRALGGARRRPQRHLHLRIRRKPLRLGGPVRRRYPQRRAIDRDWRVRVRHRRASHSSSSP